MKYTPLLILPALLLASCAAMDAASVAFGPFPYSYIQPVNPPNPSPSSVDTPPPGWENPWLVAGAATWVLPFFDDFRDITGYTLQVGAGGPFGAGLRYMDFDCKQRATGNRFDAHTLLAYLGVGFTLNHSEDFRSGIGTYYGGALGATELDRPSSDDWGFSGGGVCGIIGYCNVGPADHPAAVVGLSAELGVFFSAPNDMSLSGMTAMLGMYIDF